MAIEHKFIDVNIDRKRIAHLLYRMASDKSIVAMYSSGLNLCYGSGVKQDIDRAAIFLKKALNNNSYFAKE